MIELMNTKESSVKDGHNSGKQLNLLKILKTHLRLLMWRMDRRVIPPPHLYKQKVILKYQRETGYATLIETGTYLGDMVEAMKRHFSKIYSIELSNDLYNNALIRFKNDKHIILLQGDSSSVLSSIMSEINSPAIFWLDGHYSGGETAQGMKICPIMEELDAIFSNPSQNHILLIDDARLFESSNDYPTIRELTDLITRANKNYDITIKNDIIRCKPKTP